MFTKEVLDVSCDEPLGELSMLRVNKTGKNKSKKYQFCNYSNLTVTIKNRGMRLDIFLRKRFKTVCADNRSNFGLVLISRFILELNRFRGNVELDCLLTAG